MKFLILIFGTLALANCAVPRRELHPDAKPVFEHPKFDELRKKLFPGLQETKGRIWNGNEAVRGQFPYQALLYMLDPAAGWYLCGGSFVRPKYVLSAAHCISGFQEIDVIGGTISTLETEPDEFFYKVLNRAHLISHENYMPNLIRNDVGVIYMENARDDIFSTPYIQPIALPIEGDANVDLTGRIIEMSGFGMMDDQDRSTVLRYGYAPAITTAECQATFGVLNVQAQHLCVNTRDGHASTCSGEWMLFVFD